MVGRVLRDVGRERRYRATRSHASSTRTSSLARPVATNHERQPQPCGDIRRLETLRLQRRGRVIPGSSNSKCRCISRDRSFDLNASPRAEEMPAARVHAPLCIRYTQRRSRGRRCPRQVEIASSDARTARLGVGRASKPPSIRHQMHRFGEVGLRMTRCVYLMHRERPMRHRMPDQRRDLAGRTNNRKTSGATLPAWATRSGGCRHPGRQLTL